MKSFEDVAVCPKCNNDLEIYSTDEIDFGLDGEGKYKAYCKCNSCGSHVKLTYYFNYDIKHCDKKTLSF